MLDLVGLMRGEYSIPTLDAFAMRVPIMESTFKPLLNLSDRLAGVQKSRSNGRREKGRLDKATIMRAITLTMANA